MKKLLLALALLASGSIAQAQTTSGARVEATLVDNYDVTTVAYTYLAFADRNSEVDTAPMTGVLGPGTAVTKLVTTSGSNTTITAVSSNAPFQGLAVGDLLLFTVGGEEYERTISTFTSANSVVVNEAIDLSANSTFRFKKRRAGQLATSGWFDVSSFNTFNIQYSIATINATSLTFVLECRNSPFEAGNAIHTSAAMTVAQSNAVAVLTIYDQCRVGWLIDTDGGAQSVSVAFTGVQQ